jgi:hypothetical protein
VNRPWLGLFDVLDALFGLPVTSGAVGSRQTTVVIVYALLSVHQVGVSLTSLSIWSTGRR